MCLWLIVYWRFADRRHQSDVGGIDSSRGSLAVVGANWYKHCTIPRPFGYLSGFCGNCTCAIGCGQDMGACGICKWLGALRGILTRLDLEVLVRPIVYYGLPLIPLGIQRKSAYLGGFCAIVPILLGFHR